MSVAVTKCVDQECKGRRRLAAAGVIEMITRRTFAFRARTGGVAEMTKQ
jgi:hypothetical protein